LVLTSFAERSELPLEARKGPGHGRLIAKRYAF
jgi:hypothetical protein